MGKGNGSVTRMFSHFTKWCKDHGFDLRLDEDQLKVLAAILLYGKYSDEMAEVQRQMQVAAAEERAQQAQEVIDAAEEANANGEKEEEQGSAPVQA